MQILARRDGLEHPFVACQFGCSTELDKREIGFDERLA